MSDLDGLGESSGMSPVSQQIVRNELFIAMCRRSIEGWNRI